MLKSSRVVGGEVVLGENGWVANEGGKELGGNALRIIARSIIIA